MDIGVIGAGSVGMGLAKLWIKAGHDVMISFARDEESLRERARSIGAKAASPSDAAAFGAAIAFAPPFAAINDALAAAGQLDGKTLIDCTNDVQERAESSAAEMVAAVAPGAYVIKAFNTVFAPLYGRSVPGGARPHLFYCGHEEGKQVAASLIADAGFEPVDAGDITVAADLEAFARLVIGTAYAQGFGRFLYRLERPED